MPENSTYPGSNVAKVPSAAPVDGSNPCTVPFSVFSIASKMGPAAAERASIIGSNTKPEPHRTQLRRRTSPSLLASLNVAPVPIQKEYEHWCAPAQALVPLAVSPAGATHWP